MAKKGTPLPFGVPKGKPKTWEGVRAQRAKSRAEEKGSIKIKTKKTPVKTKKAPVTTKAKKSKGSEGAASGSGGPH